MFSDACLGRQQVFLSRLELKISNEKRLTDIIKVRRFLTFKREGSAWPMYKQPFALLIIKHT